MDYSIVDLRTLSFDKVIDFYEQNTDVPARWYRRKLEAHFTSGKLLGRVCVDNASGSIVGAYLGLDQPLLCNPVLKAVQSIDTLISPQARGGNLLRRIGEAFYSDLAARGYDCVYGLPTTRSEPLRVRALGWNKARTTRRYLVPVPTPVLRLMHLVLRSPSSSGTHRRQPELEALIRHLTGDGPCICHDSPALLFVAYQSGLFTKVGFIRTRRNLGWLDRLRTLCSVAAASPGWFLLTYATEDSETATLFSSFSLSKKALNFSGRVLRPGSRFSFGETSFEFVEFDTFGLT